MTIVSIPDIVVLETVDVHVQAVRVDIHVRNVELYDGPSRSLPIYRAREIRLNFIWDEEVHKRTAPTEKFLFVRIIITLLQAVANKILNNDSKQS